jgi:PAS domain-containing protein
MAGSSRSPPPRSRARPLTLSLTVTRLAGDRLVAVISDITEQVQQQRALAEREAHYGAVVSVLSEGILVHDPQGGLLLCNAAAERMAGRPGHDWRDFSPCQAGGAIKNDKLCRRLWVDCDETRIGSALLELSPLPPIGRAPGWTKGSARMETTS